MIFWAIPPPRNFAKIHARGGRGLQLEQPKDSIPPWGTHRNAAGAARAFAGAAQARRCVWRRDGCFRGAESRSLPSGRRAANGARAGLGRVGPTKAACRARRRGAGTCRAAGRGRYTAAFRGGRGEGAAGGGAGKTAAPSAACVGFQATSAIEAASGRKSPFLPYKEALFSGRGSCQIRAVLRPNPCRFGRVAFSAARSDECVTPGGAGEKPRRKTKRPSERSAPHEKPDLRYRD